MQSTNLAAGNIIVPNGTFVVELVVFVVVLLVLWRWVLPPVRKAMTDRQGLIKSQLADGHAAAERLKETQVEYQRALSEARTTAAGIRDEARAEAGVTRDEILAEADQERTQVLTAGREELSNERVNMVRQLRGELGDTAVELSGRILGESLVEDARRRGTVERFLAELDSDTGETPAGVGGRR